MFSSLCSDDDGNLLFFTDDDDDEGGGALKSLWSLSSWANDVLVYTSAIIHRDNGVVPKVVKRKVDEGQRGMYA